MQITCLATVRTPNSSHYEAINHLPKSLQKTGKFLTEMPLTSHDQESVVIVSGSLDMTVMVWDYRKKKALYQFKGHQREITSVAGFVSPSRHLMVVSTSDDFTVKIWRVSSSACSANITKHSMSARSVSALHLTRDGEASSEAVYNSTILVTAGWDKILYPRHEVVEDYGIFRTKSSCAFM